MNTVILLGRLVREPEVRYTNNGKACCRFTLAIDRPYNSTANETKADFIPVVIWDKCAELIGNRVRKGDRLLVDGRIESWSYEAKDGTKRYGVEVNAKTFKFIEPSGERSKSTPNNSSDEQHSVMERFGSEVDGKELVPF